MKKLIVLSIALLAAMAVALPANADLTWSANEANALVTLGSGSAGDHPNTYGLSNNVYLYYDGGDHQNYVLGSAHKSGNRGYGSASSTTLIYYQTKNPAETSVDMSGVTPGTAVTFGNAWTAL
jgi:hypothetical protein